MMPIFACLRCATRVVTRASDARVRDMLLRDERGAFYMRRWLPLRRY